MNLASPKAHSGNETPALPAVVRVLVVEDNEPFRRFVCSMLKERTELRIISNASDGLEAVQKARELQPNLIILDIGLPTLNGIDAARRIRKLAPQSKIIFLSMESSADVVQEALALGALGYVVKADAGRELLICVDAVRQGRQFIGARFSGDVLNQAEDGPPELNSPPGLHHPPAEQM